MKLTVKEVKEKLFTIKNEEHTFIQICMEDERKGVQTALKQWFKQREKEANLIHHYQQMDFYEEKARDLGYQMIAGIDEVGRGPLAGPVVAAAVILNKEERILGLDDSKKLSLKKREALFLEIKEKAQAIGIGTVSAQEIDQTNILIASKKAMQEAVNNLNKAADLLLVDAVSLESSLPQKQLIQGDMKSNSIAAASIIAKVTRDELMATYEKSYPGYGFSSNVGYGTKEHLNGLRTLGACPIHRKTFAPVKNI